MMEMDSRIIKDEMTIEILEGSIWPSPEFASHVVLMAHELRKKPLNKLTTEDLRLGLTQQIGLSFVTSRALEALKADPMIDATYYPGDLLQAVLHVPREFWEGRPSEKLAIDEIWSNFIKRIADMDDDWRRMCLPAIIKEYDQYKGKVPATKRLR